MSIRPLIRYACLALFAATLHGAPLSPVHYTLNFDDALHHYVQVQADLPTDGAEELELFMPVWTPGSYLIREYSRNLDRIEATSPDGTPLEITKTTKNRWVVKAKGNQRVILTYRLYGWEINVRGNWIEGDFAMINGAPTYLTVVENYQRPYTVKVELPTNWAGSYTPLLPDREPNTYTAPDFDTLIDSPLLAGSPQVDSFVLDGTPHYLVTIGGAGIWDNARVARNFAKVAEEEMKFWGGLPSKEPYYIFNLLTGERGGLEHKHAFVMMADRALSLTRGGIGSWLSLASHEYFHAWNGKRLRPAALGPFDYEHENYTSSLWIVEGITSYYQHIMLRRAGFSTRDGLLATTSGLIRQIETTPGRLVQAIRDASFDAWIKAYRSDENSINTRQSYYSGGALLAMLLDVEIRRHSNDAKSLDDVMRAAYQRYSGAKGYTEAEFEHLVSEITGSDLSPWFNAVIHAPGQLDYQPMLDWYGLEFAPPTKADASLLPNRLEPADGPRGWLGAATKSNDGHLTVTGVREGTPAYDGGLYVDDELIAVDGFRIEVSMDSLLKRYAPGDVVKVLVARRGQLITLPVILGQEPQQTWRLQVRKDATPEQKAHLEAWLGLDEPIPADRSAKDSTTYDGGT